MPTYEYECTNRQCGHVFDRFQNIADKPVQRCPRCRCKVRRLIGTGAGIIFKGSGFYETDYKRGASYESARKQETETSTTAAKKPEGTDSPAPKPAPAKPAKAASSAA